jgi:hypothetical protein
MRVMLAALAIVAIGVTACTASKSLPPQRSSGTAHLSESNDNPGDTQPRTTTSFAGLILTHPAAWTFVATERPTAGPSGSLGFLSSQPPQPQCKDLDHAVFRCGAPVARLTAGGVLLSVGARFFGSDQIMPNATIAHLPSQVSTQLTPSECPPGATFEEAAAVNLPKGGTLRLTACAAEPDIQTRDTISDMFTTADYRH